MKGCYRHVIQRSAAAHDPTFAPSLNPFGNRIVAGWPGTARERVTVFSRDAHGPHERSFSNHLIFTFAKTRSACPLPPLAIKISRCNNWRDVPRTAVMHPFCACRKPASLDIELQAECPEICLLSDTADAIGAQAGGRNSCWGIHVGICLL